MFLIFFLTFHVIGAFLSDLLALGIDRLTALTDAALTAYGLNPVVQSLIIDGIFEGVGSVLSFLPVIVTLFFLPVYSGRHRLYGTRGVCDGQAAAAHRSFR